LTGINDWWGYFLAGWYYIFVWADWYQWLCDFWGYMFDAVNYMYDGMAYMEENRYMEADLAEKALEEAKKVGKD